jgi:dTDP-4-dehydrorhamnose 3,5-epimerase
MKLTPLGIKGAWLAESPVWGDERGFFREWFRPDAILEQTGFDFSVLQANSSLSKKGVVRGIHYSLKRQGQAKWVTCMSGRIQDVIVDIRPHSETFGNWIEFELDSKSGKSLLIGGDLGHAFLALEDNSIVSYLVTEGYSAIDEHSIDPFDITIGINWKIDLPSLIISDKDKKADSIKQKLAKIELPKKR